MGSEMTYTEEDTKWGYIVRVGGKAVGRRMKAGRMPLLVLHTCPKCDHRRDPWSAQTSHCHDCGFDLSTIKQAARQEGEK